jgi:hypothetical protein
MRQRPGDMPATRDFTTPLPSSTPPADADTRIGISPMAAMGHLPDSHKGSGYTGGI